MICLGPLPASVPIFSAGPLTGSGLDLLATAALSSKAPNTVTGGGSAPLPRLDMQGPYNPIAGVTTHVAKKILELEFVEVAEITAEDDTSFGGRPSSSFRPPVTNISQWIKRFSVMAAILVTRFLGKAPEFLAYQAPIVRSEWNYEGLQWVIYDRQYRRDVLARKDLNWSVLNSRLYNEAFTGRARAIPRCTHCLGDDHAAGSCPLNPSFNVVGVAPSPSPTYHQGGLSEMPEFLTVRGAEDCNAGTSTHAWDVMGATHILTVHEGAH